jgi:DNA modification methylase
MTPWLDDGDVRLYHGDSLQVLQELPDRSVHMCATSPPFYGLRDYGTGEWDGGDPGCDHVLKGSHKPQPRLEQGLTDGGVSAWSARDVWVPPSANECELCGARRVDKQIGLEETPDQWVQNLVRVFREVRRVLRDDGTLWVEIGDSYNGGGVGGGPPGERLVGTGDFRADSRSTTRAPNVKQKDLLGQPWLLAFALRADGWWLRSEIIWARPNPMPESVTDRPTKSHSTVFLLSKQPRYFYDADAIREGFNAEAHAKAARAIARDDYTDPSNGSMAKPRDAFTQHRDYNPGGANARSVWNIPTQPTPFAHFATWPEALCRRMILAGSPEGGVVLDPFAGSGTTCLVARNHGRHSIGIELNEQYLEIAAKRLQQLSLLA